jgi:enoyl-CoA hydratase/carnithine racemase
VSTRLVATPHQDILSLTLESEDEYPRLEKSVLNALAAEVRHLLEASEFKAAIITGSEKAFAAGAEISELAQLTPTNAFEFSRHGQSVFGKIARSPKPIIAAIRGYCIGGGLDLALACHARIATPDAVFAHPGASLGIITGWGGTQRLPRLIGRARAAEMFLTASRITANEALHYGVITQISEPASLQSDAATLARQSSR